MKVASECGFWYDTAPKETKPMVLLVEIATHGITRGNSNFRNQ